MENTPKVTVVIVNWERPQDTLACLQSLFESTITDIHIILVDNGSRDSSVEQISRAYPQVDIVSLPKNLGFAGGYNIGIERALATQVKHIFLLNNDTIVEPETIQELLAAPWDVGVPKIMYYPDQERIWAAGCAWRNFPPSVIMVGYNQNDAPIYSIPKSLEYATGCALMVRRDVLEKIGGFDPEFTNYMEDYDFSYRTTAAGFTIGYVPSSRVYHKVSQSLGEYTPERWHHQGKNTVLFYRKNNRFPLWQLWTFLLWVSFRELFKGHAHVIPGFWRGVFKGFKNMRT